MGQDTETIIKITNVSKEYHLGQIGGTTLRAELQRKMAKLRHLEDPTQKIGQRMPDKYGMPFKALDDISLEIKKGEAVGIIGHNGAGKSTLLKLLCRVTAPTEGIIQYNGRISSMLEVGTGFHPELTGRENIYLNGAILGMNRNEIDEKIEDIIEFSECRQFIDTPVKRYSSGMYVKLAFSVAAHLDSEIMIMDEVLAVGDMRFQQKCLQKMREAASNEGRTVLYVSHNMNTIRQLCDRCIVLNKGKIEYIGDIESSIERYLGLTGDLQCHYSYDDSYHSNKKSSDQIRLTGLDITDREESRYKLGEIIQSKLHFTAKKDINNVKIRFEIQYQDGTIAGTAFSGEAFDVERNSTLTVTASFDPRGLAPGRYRADIVIYDYNRFGVEHYIDGVYPGFMFEIDEDNNNNELVWNHRHWGHVKFNDIVVK